MKRNILFILALHIVVSLQAAIFSGIGGCSSAELQVFIPASGCFETGTGFWNFNTDSETESK